MFLVELTFGINRDDRLAVRPAHRDYLKRLAEDGVLAVSGPLASDTGAVLIFDVADRADVDRIVAADPYTPANVIAEVRVREWNPIAGKWFSP